MTSTAGLTVQDVRRALNAIIDPCSIEAGLPAGLDDMGLVRNVEVRPGEVTVHLAITSPGCMMGPSFVSSAREALTKLPGISHADVVLSDWADWSEDAMSPDYRDRLERVRLQRRRRLPLLVVNRQTPNT